MLADAWKPYMKNLDAEYTDASCYESMMRFPTDVKLLWECVQRAYKMMCGISADLGERMMRIKYNEGKLGIQEAAQVHSQADTKDDHEIAIVGQDAR